MFKHRNFSIRPDLLDLMLGMNTENALGDLPTRVSITG